MQEVFEKIIEKLEENSFEMGKDSFPAHYVRLNKAIEIVKQEAAEYNNGWIPVSSGNFPNKTGNYLCTVEWYGTSTKEKIQALGFPIEKRIMIVFFLIIQRHSKKVMNTAHIKYWPGKMKNHISRRESEIMIHENIRIIKDIDSGRFEWCIQNAINDDGMQIADARILIKKDKDIEKPYYTAILVKKEKRLNKNIRTIPICTYKTNADRIREMSDEELAEWLTKITDDAQLDAETKCNYQWKDWIQSEVEE